MSDDLVVDADELREIVTHERAAYLQAKVDGTVYEFRVSVTGPVSGQ